MRKQRMHGWEGAEAPYKMYMNVSWAYSGYDELPKTAAPQRAGTLLLPLVTGALVLDRLQGRSGQMLSAFPLTARPGVQHSWPVKSVLHLP